MQNGAGSCHLLGSYSSANLESLLLDLHPRTVTRAMLAHWLITSSLVAVLEERREGAFHIGSYSPQQEKGMKAAVPDLSIWRL